METKGLRAKRFPYPAPWGGTFLIQISKKKLILKKDNRVPPSKTLECTQTVSSLLVYSKQVAGFKKYLLFDIVGDWC